MKGKFHQTLAALKRFYFCPSHNSFWFTNLCKYKWHND